MSFTILIVDDEENARQNYREFLNERGYDTLEAETLAAARDILKTGSADIVLLDVRLPDGYGPNLLDETALQINRPPIILITGAPEIDMAVSAMKNGAHDFLQKPISLEDLEKSIRQAGETVAMRRELAHLREQQFKDDFILGKSDGMKELYRQAQRASEVSASVLINGETGTGKGILAKAIHQMGPRAKKAFVQINCANFRDQLIESELFGYEAGAFTGAEKRKPGLMEVADGGVLFLDELPSMGLDMQAKLLTSLENQAFRRVGGVKEISVDVQVIAATNQSLNEMIAASEFRSDLYYRLCVADLHVPALRERSEDIPDLVGFFLRDLNPQMGLNIYDITPRAMEMLVNYGWPGNIRELRNALERSLMFCEGAEIDVSHLPSDISGQPAL
jgi:DNA-binding NtrC family response regulator